MMMYWADFAAKVVDAGLVPRRCNIHPTHWQITGGKKLVNCWPNTKRRGFVLAVEGQKGRKGTLAEAIHLAAPKKVSKPQPEPLPTHEPAAAPWQSREERRVGLIRRVLRCLRWIW